MRISDWSSDVCSSDLLARRGCGVPYDSIENTVAGRLEVSGDLQGHFRNPARHRVGHRADRLRQVDDTGGDGQSHQRERIRAYPDGRGPDQVRPSAEKVSDQTARSSPRTARLQRGADRKTVV